MKCARILIADDHAMTLEGIRAVLEPPHEIVGAVCDGRALLNAAMRLKPDLAVIDITMPLLNGIDAVIQMKKRLRGVKVIFVTMHMNPAYLDAALAAGATGYVLKTAAREELLAAVESVVGGRTYLTQGLPRAHPANIPTRPDNPARLSPRERETLQLIAQGKASKEIAGILNISVRTVDFHRENLKRKLKLKTIADLTRHAIELDLA